MTESSSVSSPTTPAATVTPRWQRPLQIIAAERRAVLVLSVFSFALLLAGMGAGVLFPGLNQARTDGMAGDGTNELVGQLLSSFWLFAITIVGVNVSTVALPVVAASVIIPFAGIAFFGYKAFTIGLTLAPINQTVALTLIPHSLAIIIEFAGYILCQLGAYLIGRSWLLPATVDAPTRIKGYLRGLQLAGWVCLPGLALLIIGSLYEAFELIHLVPPLVAR